jgi:hypothetical protein
VDHHTLNEFHHGLYGCFERTADARLPETTPHSLVELSLSPCSNGSGPASMKRWKTGGLIRASCDSYWPVSRLQQLSPIECLAVTDAVERWWPSPTYHIPREEATYE